MYLLWKWKNEINNKKKKREEEEHEHPMRWGEEALWDSLEYGSAWQNQSLISDRAPRESGGTGRYVPVCNWTGFSSLFPNFSFDHKQEKGCFGPWDLQGLRRMENFQCCNPTLSSTCVFQKSQGRSNLLLNLVLVVCQKAVTRVGMPSTW